MRPAPRLTPRRQGSEAGVKFSQFFVERPIFAAVLSLLIVVGGALSLLRLPISEYPGVVPPTVVVRGVYPGANPKVIAETVASPLEQAIAATAIHAAAIAEIFVVRPLIARASQGKNRTTRLPSYDTRSRAQPLTRTSFLGPAITNSIGRVRDGLVSAGEKSSRFETHR